MSYAISLYVLLLKFMFIGNLSFDINDNEITLLSLFRYIMKMALLVIQPRGMLLIDIVVDMNTESFSINE